VIGLALLLCLAGVGRFRHRRKAWGSGLLAAAYLACATAAGPSLGLVWWCGECALAAALIVLLRPCLPRRAQTWISSIL